MRRYRIGPDGQETPVWASKAKLEEMGRQEGRDAARERRLPATMGNRAHDGAAWAAYQDARGVLACRETRAEAEEWVFDQVYPKSDVTIESVRGQWWVILTPAALDRHQRYRYTIPRPDDPPRGDA